MAKLGADFNASQPASSDFVRHPSRPNLATEIRHVRDRLKAFFGTMLNLEDGDFLDNVIPASALVDHPDKPATGATKYTKVTVDQRGFITKGETTPVYTEPRIFRAVYTTTSGWYEKPDGLVIENNPSTEFFPKKVISSTGMAAGADVKTYDFLVPEKVQKVQLFLISSHEPKMLTTGFRVSPNTVYKVAVGVGKIPVQNINAGTPSVFMEKDASRYATSEYTRQAIDLTGEYKSSPYGAIFSRSPYLPYGTPNNGGLVVVEWYA